MYVMTADEFVAMARKAEQSEVNIYCNSCFGSNLTYASMIEQYTTETTWDVTHAAETIAKANAAKAAGKPCYGWDCVNLVKGILWSWTGDTSTPRAGAKYQSNGVPDATIWDIYTNYCTDQSENFDNIAVGEFLVYSNTFGHCGIYIGDGLVIEATTKWDSKVQISQMQNMIDSGKYKQVTTRTRKWWAHAKLPWVDYSAQDVTPVPQSTKSTFTCPCCHSVIDMVLTYTPEVNAPKTRKYVVAEGNTLYGIARDMLGNGERWPEIAALNDLHAPYNIHTGEVLTIPAK